MNSGTAIVDGQKCYQDIQQAADADGNNGTYTDRCVHTE